MKERPVVVEMEIEVSEGYQKENVRDDMIKQFNFYQQASRPGEPLYVSSVRAMALEVDGTKSVEVTKFRYANRLDDTALAEGIIRVKPTEKVKIELFLIFK